MKALALDFDGVISDSAREAFAVALRTFAELRPGGAIERAATEPDLHAAFYARFLALMPLGNRAEDYGVVLAACQEGIELPDQAAYDVFYRSLPGSLLADFHARFYEVRRGWRDTDREGWLAQMATYPRLLEILRRRAGDTTLAIATAKDRASVLPLLECYGIADLFAEDRILDKENGVSKRTHLERLAATLSSPVHEITFVDDKVNHLDDVAGLGVRCALASWGYNGPREQARARELGFLVCGLDDFERQLIATI